MRIETVVINCLKDNIPELVVTNEEFLKGVLEYSRDYNLASLANEGQSQEITDFLLNSFLEPFLKMPVNNVCAYFEHYALIKNFKLLSNTILELSVQKNMNQNKDVFLPAEI